MSAGGFPLDLSTGKIPTPEELLAQLGEFNLPPEAMEVLNNYAMVLAMMSQIGQVQVGMADAAARQAEIDFRTQHELPFRLQELENSRLLAELNLQFQRERAENELQQLQQRGSYDARIQALGTQQALLNLATQREQAAMNNRAMRSGSGRFSPQGVISPGRY